MCAGRRQLYRLALVVLSVLMIACYGQGEAAAGDRSENEIPAGWKLLPRLGLGLEYGGYAVQQEVFTSMLRRRLEIDALQYRRHILYLEFDEHTYFGTPSDRWDFNLMRYDIHLGSYRYDFGDFYLGLFIHHQCNNPFLTQKYLTLVDRVRANFYFVGLEFLTKNMRLGMKDRGINFGSSQAFEFLGRWAGAASVARTFVSENADLDWLLSAKVRFDICRYQFLVPYVEVGADLLTGQALRAAPTVEMGARCHISRIDITPFFQWGRTQEFLTKTLGPTTTTLAARNYLYGGVRLETLLDADSFLPLQDGSRLQFLPEIHGTADYGLHLRKRYFNGRGNIELDFEALRYDPWTLFLYTGMNFDSRKQDFKPDKVIYWLQYGLTYTWQKYFVEGFVENNKRLDANSFRRTQERSNRAGLRLGTKGMKPGHFNDGISFSGPNNFEWLNNWNGQGSVSHFFQNRDWQYLWNLTTQVRWDVLRWYIAVPYIQGEINWMSGGGRTDDALEYAGETGLRFHGALDLALYYRFQKRENVIFFGGPSENQSIVGLKALF